MNVFKNLVLSNYDIYDKILLNDSYHFDDEIKLTAEIPTEFSTYIVIKTFHAIYHGFQAVLLEN